MFLKYYVYFAYIQYSILRLIYRCQSVIAFLNILECKSYQWL